MANEFERIHSDTRQIFRWAEAKAQDADQTEIDTTHLLHATLLNGDIRNWLRSFKSISVETATLLVSLQIPFKPEPEPLTMEELAADPLMLALMEGGLFSPTPEYLQKLAAREPGDIEKLTDKAVNAVRIGVNEAYSLDGYYVYPIHILSGITQADEALAEHVLLGRGLNREELNDKIRSEEQRVRLAESTANLETYMGSRTDFLEKLRIAKQIDKLIQ